MTYIIRKLILNCRAKRHYTLCDQDLFKTFLLVICRCGGQFLTIFKVVTSLCYKTHKKGTNITFFGNFGKFKKVKLFIQLYTNLLEFKKIKQWFFIILLFTFKVHYTNLLLTRASLSILVKTQILDNKLNVIQNNVCSVKNYQSPDNFTQTCFRWFVTVCSTL